MFNAASMPLTMATPGALVRLVQVTGGEESCRRLAELGLTAGVKLSVMQDEGGPLLVCVRESRIALGRGLAHKIQVMPCEECTAASEEAKAVRKPIWMRGRGSCCEPDGGAM
jgi:Fe2+ transport system protein FeoA